jgi:hypothetical protein
MHFGFRLAAVELAHEVSVDRPRGELGRRGLLALAVRALVGWTHEFAFDEDVRSLLDRRCDIFGQSRAENTDAVPLGFRGPLLLRVLLGALRGHGKNGEFWTVVPRLTLLGVGTNKSDDGYWV